MAALVDGAMSKSRRKILARRALAAFSHISPGWSAKIAAKWFMTPQFFAAPAREAKFLETATGRDKVNGCEVWRWGKGPKVLLVHGWSGRGAQMMSFVEPLVASGFEVITFDAPGHGQSGKGISNLRMFANSIQSIVAKEGPLRGVIGHSLGGAAAVLATSRGASVDKLILIGMPSDLTRVFDFFCKAVGLTAETRERFYGEVERVVGLSAGEASPLFLGPRLSTPALLLHDPNDNQVNIHHARELEKVWPEARLELIPDVGHYRILKSELTVSAARKFLVSNT